jgi:aminotransferase
MNRRASQIIQSEIRAMSIECDRVGGLNLAQGICDTGVPESIREAAKAGIDGGINSYTRYDGLDNLRRAIAHKMRTFNRIEADPESEIIVGGGSTGSFYCALMSLLNPGDEVVVFEPYYGYHVNTLLAAELVPVYIRLHPPDWTFEVEELERVLTPRTKALVVNTPANPTGKVFTLPELQSLARIARERDLIVLTDEIYEYFVFDGRTHLSPAALPEIADRTVTISGFSKVFSITGWRIGYSICRADWAQWIGYWNDLVYVCAPAPLQHGVAEGIHRLGPDYFAGLCRSYEEKRNRICRALDAAGLKPYVPQGAYYVLADASVLPGRTSKEKTMALLGATGVAGVPADAFFHDPNESPIIRFCFAKKEDELEEACRRLERL